MTPAEFKASRKHLGLTQTELGQALGYGHSEQSAKAMVWAKEHGRRPVTQRDALALEALEARQGMKRGHQHGG